ncbi:MAG: DUF2147 domain-containing protein [Acidobacteriota bacterium]
MKVRWMLFCCLFFCLSGAPLLASDGDRILGIWASAPSDDGIAHVEIFRRGDTYGGRIVWLEKPNYGPEDRHGMAGMQKVDRENPDPDRRGRPLVGLEILEGFRYDGDGGWNGATIYDPDNGKTYRSKAWLESDDVLGLRGFVGISLLGRSTRWSRVRRQVQAGSLPSGG